MCQQVDALGTSHSNINVPGIGVVKDDINRSMGEISYVEKIPYLLFRVTRQADGRTI